MRCCGLRIVGCELDVLPIGVWFVVCALLSMEIMVLLLLLFVVVLRVVDDDRVVVVGVFVCVVLFVRCC